MISSMLSQKILHCVRLVRETYGDRHRRSYHGVVRVQHHPDRATGQANVPTPRVLNFQFMQILVIDFHRFERGHFRGRLLFHKNGSDLLRRCKNLAVVDAAAP